jgi:type II restriction/modification system DNA methylase subunit YeeA
MNTKNLKAYAPKARRQFIEAVQKRAAHFGIYEDRIAEAKEEGSSILIEGRVFTKQQGQQRKRLAQRVEERGYEMFTREMAYTWFNRLAAIRYMEIHDYLEHGFRVLSHPLSNDSLPEILDHASDVADTLGLDKSHIIELQLAGDKEEELYRELLLGQCHYLATIMPFAFKGLTADSIDDAAELLLPDNLTKTDSILKGLINEIPEEDWQSIEVIGWLYQFYISEHKDSIIGKVVKSEDIPAATQLFTPNWIVKYLVQNSLGRQGLATYPGSELKGKMEYYIEPAEQSDDVVEQLKAITPVSIDPEEIKIIDPAVGSGHILVEVYEVLREIYLERGYRLREIPELILTKNIYGLDIDDRAAQLAGFALMMKAREDDRRIFQRVQDGEVTLNIYSLQSTESLDVPSLWRALDLESNQQQGSTGGLFDMAEGSSEPSGIYKEYYVLLQTLKSAFLQAKTLGSLIQIENEHLANLAALKELLQAKEQGSDPAAKQATLELLPIINQAIILAQRYSSLCANPPYMGSKYHNPDVKDHLIANYRGADKDLFTSFIWASGNLINKNGYASLMTPNVWLYLNSHVKVREDLLNDKTFRSLVELPLGGFKGATVQICAFTFQNKSIQDFTGSYIRLVGIKGGDKEMADATKAAILSKSSPCYFTNKPDYFRAIPNNPLAYWVSKKVLDNFQGNPTLKEIAIPRQGLATMNNALFTREWFEVSLEKFSAFTENENVRWFPYNKGGDYRKWYGNQEVVVDWEKSGKRIKDLAISRYGSASKRVVNEDSYFLPSITWSKIGSGNPSFRFQPEGAIFDVAGMSIFVDSESDLVSLLTFLNSNVALKILQFLSPTLNFEAGQIGSLPIVQSQKDLSNEFAELLNISKNDWDSFETSWEFKSLSFLQPIDSHLNLTLKSGIEQFFDFSREKARRTAILESEIDQHYIDQYGLGDDMAPTEDLKKISLFRNQERFKFNSFSHIVIELTSFTLGCMMGRYSLDREGLVYAHSGNEGFKELVVEGVYQTFPADDDGIVPLASEEWLFDDDATTRFKEFVKTVWGKEHLDENLEFVAESLCLHALKPKKGEGAMDTVRRYFSTQFFKDHCKTYKKRPIYWLFSSGKEKAFECLVYLHRYNEGTLSRMRTVYVTPLMGKYEHMLNHLADKLADATSSEKRDIEKEQKSLTKKQAELRTFDEQLKHYAEMRITLDLDDGVKANYGKFGNLLADVKAIHGSAPKVVK